MSLTYNSIHDRKIELAESHDVNDGCVDCKIRDLAACVADLTLDELEAAHDWLATLGNFQSVCKALGELRDLKRAQEKL